MLAEDQHQAIERYINKEMTEQEVTAFEQEVATDNTLAQTLALYQNIPNRIKNFDKRQDFRNDVRTIGTAYLKERNNNRSKYIWIGLVVLIIAIGSLIWYFNPFEPTTPIIPDDVPIATLWEDTKKPTAAILRGSSTDIENVLKYEAAYDDYETQNYTAAIEHLDSISTDAIFYADVLKLKGVCEYELERYSEAIDSYNAYLELPEIARDLVLWYQALAYIQNNQNDKAKENLQIIIDKKYSKREEAEVLLKRL